MTDYVPVGERIDALGVMSTIEDGDLVSAAVVLMKVVEPDGTVRLTIGWSDGMSWIERLGMLTAATAAETPTDDEEV